jgi:F-box/leucine-rich repeat protein 10/11
VDFHRLCWYAGEQYLRDLRSKEEFSLRVLESIGYLSTFLMAQARSIERGTESARKEAKEQVPLDRVKDPSAVARELRWRAKAAAGQDSGDENEEMVKKGDSVLNGLANAGELKRRRLDLGGAHETIFRNFRPKVWDNVTERAAEEDLRAFETTRLVEGELSKWLEWEDGADEGDRHPVQVKRRKEETTRVRRLGPNRLERQRIERVVEEWVWT